MAARSRQHRGAFTLIEMLIVMGIVAVLATMTVASYVSVTRRNAREGGVETVMNLLRQAHMSAVDSGRGAVARIDAADRSVYGLSSKVEAAWHFEDVFSTGGNDFTSGARAMNAQLVNGTALVGDGALGLCLEFDGNNDYVDAGTYPVYNMTQGLRFEANVWPDGAAATLGVADKAAAGVDGYALWLEEEGTGPGQLQQYSVHARITIQDELDDTSYELILDSDDVHIPQGTWSHVALEYDGFEARLLVGGRLVDLDSLLGEVSDENDPNPSTDKELDSASAPSLLEPARAAPLRIGVADVGGDQFFAGRIDEPRLLSVAGGERMRMPPRVPIVSTDDAVYFDAQGYLDLAYHSSDVYAIVGDPYQSAQLQNALAADDATITVGPDNPFPAGGGLLLIDGELIRYASANGPDLTVNDPTDGADRGGRGTGAAVHQQGSTVYFARVLRVTQTGLVERVMHDSDIWD